MSIGLSFANPSYGDSAGNGGIDSGPHGGGLTVGLTVSSDGTPGVAANSPGAYRPYKIVSFPIGDHTIDAEGLCANPAGFQGLGWYWDITVISNATGSIVSHRADCIALPDPTLPGPLPATTVPAQPPTIGEIWQTAAIPNPSLSISPPNEGVTGLDTWIWTSSPDTVTINATINGWSVTGIASRIGYALDGTDGADGDGQIRYSAVGGSIEQPAFNVVFQTKGQRDLRIASRWTANLSMSGPGLPATPTDLGTATLTTQTIYPVAEIRSSLTN